MKVEEESALVRSRQDFEQTGKRDMEAALAESLMNYEREFRDNEQQILLSSKA